MTSRRNRAEGDGVSFGIEGPRATRAVVLHIELKTRGDGALDRDAESRLAEAVGLAEAIDLVVAERLIVPLAQRRPATLIGAGKVEELATVIRAVEAELAIVNAQVSPIQQRNLEKAWACKVLDRTGLILEIFGRRAVTREGSLQVELAHLEYQKSRLVRSWTHLERQRGGFGFLGGPGESQLETDRRLIEERIARIETALAKVVKTRTLHRKGRARVPYPVVALVGYTNAGKSTLFNALTRARVVAKDLLFATLDPTMRQVALPLGRKIVLSDTVGFISNLPTALIAAFRATLEEVLSADLILHVRDVSHPETEAQAADVRRVLADLGIAEARREAVVEVWNKADLLDADARAARTAQAARRADAVLVSARDGDGLDALLAVVEARLAIGDRLYDVFLDPADGRGLAWLHERSEVLSKEAYGDGRVRVTVRMAADRRSQAAARFGRSLRAARSADAQQ